MINERGADGGKKIAEGKTDVHREVENRGPQRMEK
jgi:hypothetical protein